MEDSRERWTEALLDDEGLTDGLTDAQAQILLAWAQQRVAELGTLGLPPEEEKVRAHTVRQQARRVGQIIRARQEGSGPDRLQRALSRLWPDPREQARIASQLETQETPQGQIRCLLAALEELAGPEETR